MELDEGINPLVVALPYRHGTLPKGQFKDAGMFIFCKQQGINTINGYDTENNYWIDPEGLKPDYINRPATCSFL